MKNRKTAKRVTFFLLLSLLMLSATGTIAQNRIWTLEDCIYYAIENNIRIKQSELNVEMSEVDLLESKLSLLPSLNGNTSFSYNWGRVLDRTDYRYYNRETNQAYFNLDANMRLFGGLQYQNAIKKDKIDFQASKFAADKVKDDISLLLTQAYLSIIFNKELVRVAQEQVNITNEQINRTEKMVDAGTLARGSLLEIQAQGASEEINLINYENSLELAYLDLLQLLDLPANTDFDIAIPEFDVDPAMDLIPVSDVYEYAIINQPEIKSAELDVESAYKSVDIAQGGRSPVLSLQGGWSTNYSNQFRELDTATFTYTDVIPFGEQFENNQARYLGVNLNIPIFNGYQVSSNVSRAKMQAANAEYELELTKNNLRKTIEQSYNDARAAYKTYVATQKSLNSIEESFRYTEQRFNVGMANSVDYNIAKTQLTAAESELIRTKFDYIFKTKILDFYMGKPLTLENY
ncbi:MAG: TolC family protein [Bacteroidales bacterium]